ncbi:MAG: phosphoglucosamine mutase [Chthoniobacterales bacterium]|nr:phosphoglucosamine mutase [Chthoniobacterales bacterium]
MAEHKKIFGTDGVRGVANVEPVTAETALKLGRAAAHIFTQLNPREHPEGLRPKIVLGKDTRLSGYMLENALVAGITSLGVDVLLIGPLPTPGVAYITRSLRADAGIVLSASHNPYEDNGIKFFRHDGYKLDDKVERQIEQLVFTGEIDSVRPTAGKIGRATRIDDALGRYVEFAKRSFPRGMTLEKMRLVVDAANGAAYKSTPCILRELGADLTVAHHQPDGTNINAACGSTHPEEIQRLVRQCGAQAGLAHDGDADRVLLCDENCELVDGDEILAIAAVDSLGKGQLAQETLVATVMSNYGLEEALAPHGGKVVRTQVGDRYVIEEMVRRDLNLGGEQSGHMIFRDFTTTGDGIISALQILRIMQETGKPLSELKKCLTKYPQAQRNLRVREKPPLESLGNVMKLVAETEKQLQGKGRVLLRYSGTEPKVRLLIEGRERVEIDRQADEIARAITAAIGVIPSEVERSETQPRDPVG